MSVCLKLLPPAITSLPETFALIGSTYAYDVLANDIDGDALTYELAVAPAAMSIEAGTGRLRWQPGSAQAGLHAVSVVVSDGRGGSSMQSFSVLASTVPGSSGNHPPVTLALEPAGDQIGVLREGHLSLRLVPGFTVEQARELARRLNDVVTGVTFVKY